jgi:hypothetical protein
MLVRDLARVGDQQASFLRNRLPSSIAELGARQAEIEEIRRGVNQGDQGNGINRENKRGQGGRSDLPDLLLVSTTGT